MATRETLLRIRSLKGAPSLVLPMMMALGRPTGRDELALLTTYSKRTIQDALAQLEFLGLAQNHARYNGWALTACAHQSYLTDHDPAAQPEPQRPHLVKAEVQSVHLANPATGQDGQNLHLASNATPSEVQNVHLDAFSPALAAVPAEPHRPTRAAHGAREVRNLHLDARDSTGEVQSLHLPYSSSCSPDQDTKSTPTREKPQLQAPQTRDPPPRPVLDSDAKAAVDHLTATGCPARTSAGRGAVDAIEAALAGGWTGAQVRDHVRDWLAYARRQDTITHPGLFATARIRACQPAPKPPPKSRGQAARDHVAEAYDRMVGP